jgi:hypothetical protein
MRAQTVVTIAAGSLLCAGAPPASAQDEEVASLRWTFGQTAGIRGQLRGQPGSVGDIWVIDDVGLDQPAMLTSFRAVGWVQPSSFAGRVEDVVVQIRDGMPPEGKVILESVAGSGSFTGRDLSTSHFDADFGMQRLEAGTYIIMWAAVLKTTDAVSLMWHQPGPHTAGLGEPDNGFYWKPDTGEIVEVPLMLGGGGRSGLNFTLRGVPDTTCAADCDGDGELTFFDFLCFQNLFSAGDPAADCDGDGALTLFDFLCFQNAFAAGCP